MVLVQDRLGLGHVDRLQLGLAPGDRQEPVKIVADHRGFRAHRAHVAQLLQLRIGLGAGLLGQLGLLDALLEVEQLVAMLVLLPQLPLDRLHLLVEVIFPLGLLHLALDPTADLLLDLQDGDFPLHQGEDLFQALGDIDHFQQGLLLGDLHRQVGGDGIGQLARFGDLGDGGQGLGRDLLVELHIALELLRHGAAEGHGLRRVKAVLVQDRGLGLEEVVPLGEAQQGCAGLALHQHLDRAVGQLQQLEHRGDHAHVIDGAGLRIVVGGVALGGEQDLLVAAHDLLEGLDRFFPAHEQGHDHVGKDHDVAQGQDGEDSNVRHVSLLGCVRARSRISPNRTHWPADCPTRSWCGLWPPRSRRRTQEPRRLRWTVASPIQASWPVSPPRGHGSRGGARTESVNISTVPALAAAAEGLEKEKAGFPRPRPEFGPRRRPVRRPGRRASRRRSSAAGRGLPRPRH